MLNNPKGFKSSNRNAFMVLGAIEASWAPMIPYIKERFELNEGDLGLLLLCTGLGSFLALPLVGKLCSLLGAKRLIWISGFLLALILVIVAGSHFLILSAVLLFLFGAATIGIDVGCNVNAVILERVYKEPLMSGFHGGYSLGTLIGAGFVSLLLTLGLGLISASTIMLVLMYAALILGCRYLVVDIKPYSEQKDNTSQPELKVQKGKFTLPPVPIIIIGLMCFVMYSTEGAVMSWSAVFVTQERGLDKEVAGFIYTFFAIAMTFMRLVGNRLVKRYGRVKTVVIGSLLVALGFTLCVVIPHVSGAMLGFLIVGLGAANIVPQFVSFAGTVKGIAVHQAIAFINALGYCGILCGPVIIGFLAHTFSLSFTFLCIAAVVLLMCVVAYRLLSSSQEQD